MRVLGTGGQEMLVLLSSSCRCSLSGCRSNLGLSGAFAILEAWGCAWGQPSCERGPRHTWVASRVSPLAGKGAVLQHGRVSASCRVQIAASAVKQEPQGGQDMLPSSLSRTSQRQGQGSTSQPPSPPASSRG